MFFSRFAVLVAALSILTSALEAQWYAAPVISRTLPFVPTLSTQSIARSRTSITGKIGFADSAFSQKNFETEKETGILALDGEYDLRMIIKALEFAAKERGVRFVNPFFTETGGAGWIDRSVLFAARSDITYATIECALEYAYNENTAVRFTAPFFAATVRDSYPLQSERDGVYSLPVNRDYVDRVRRVAQEALGYTARDWEKGGFGDCTLGLSYTKNYSYVWLFRNAGYGFEGSVSFPTSAVTDTAHPGAFPFGNNGSIGLSVAVSPRAEIKESITLFLPAAVTWFTSNIQENRLGMFAEPHIFSPLIATQKITPGIVLRCSPTLQWEAFFGDENITASLAYVYTRQFATTRSDARPTGALPTSYLLRGGTTPYEQAVLRNMKVFHEKRSEWEAGYLQVFVSYKNRWGELHFGYDHPFTGWQSVKTASVNLGYSYSF